jgi:hypothetical protein
MPETAQRLSAEERMNEGKLGVFLLVIFAISSFFFFLCCTQGETFVILHAGLVL